MFLSYNLGTFVQIPSPGVISQSLPGMEHFIQGRMGQIFHRGPQGDKFLEISLHGPHGRLLQHDLADPHVIRIRRLSQGRPPRQLPMMLIVPKWLAGFSGMFVDHFGYQQFFVFTAIIGMPVFILIYFVEKFASKEFEKPYSDNTKS